MEIKIKFTRDEITAMVQAKLKTMFPDQTFRVGQEYYGSSGWQAEAIQPEDDDARLLPEVAPAIMGHLDKQDVEILADLQKEADAMDKESE
jgi:hypothetical protein